MVSNHLPSTLVVFGVLSISQSPFCCYLRILGKSNIPQWFWPFLVGGGFLVMEVACRRSWRFFLDLSVVSNNPKVVSRWLVVPELLVAGIVVADKF